MRNKYIEITESLDRVYAGCDYDVKEAYRISQIIEQIVNELEKDKKICISVSFPAQIVDSDTYVVGFMRNTYYGEISFQAGSSYNDIISKFKGALALLILKNEFNK